MIAPARANRLKERLPARVSGNIRIETTYPERCATRVSLRGEHLAKLHSLKALGRGTISDTVERALDHYFTTLHNRQEASS